MYFKGEQINSSMLAKEESDIFMRVAIDRKKEQLKENRIDVVFEKMSICKAVDIWDFSNYLNGISKDANRVKKLSSSPEEAINKEKASAAEQISIFYLNELLKKNFTQDFLVGIKRTSDFTDWVKGIDFDFVIPSIDKLNNKETQVLNSDKDLSNSCIFGTDVTISQDEYFIDLKLESIKKIFDEERMANIKYLQIDNEDGEDILATSGDVLKDLFIFSKADIDDLKENILSKNDEYSNEYKSNIYAEKKLLISFFEQKKAQINKFMHYVEEELDDRPKSEYLEIFLETIEDLYGKVKKEYSITKRDISSVRNGYEFTLLDSQLDKIFITKEEKARLESQS